VTVHQYEVTFEVRRRAQAQEDAMNTSNGSAIMHTLRAVSRASHRCQLSHSTAHVSFCQGHSLHTTSCRALVKSAHKAIPLSKKRRLSTAAASSPDTENVEPLISAQSTRSTGSKTKVELRDFGTHQYAGNGESISDGIVISHKNKFRDTKGRPWNVDAFTPRPNKPKQERHQEQQPLNTRSTAKDANAGTQMKRELDPSQRASNATTLAAYSQLEQEQKTHQTRDSFIFSDDGSRLPNTLKNPLGAPNFEKSAADLQRDQRDLHAKMEKLGLHFGRESSQDEVSRTTEKLDMSADEHKTSSPRFEQEQRLARAAMETLGRPSREELFDKTYRTTEPLDMSAGIPKATTAPIPKKKHQRLQLSDLSVKKLEADLKPAPTPSPIHRKPASETWQIQKAALAKKFGAEGWNPRKKVSPDTQDGIRDLHAQDPERWSTPNLANHFKISPEAIRRILSSKWKPKDEAAMQKRREQWAKRHDRIWDYQAELGLRPERKKSTDVEDPERFDEEMEAKEMLDVARKA
jgi:hypothetical protein